LKFKACSGLYTKYEEYYGKNREDFMIDLQQGLTKETLNFHEAHISVFSYSYELSSYDDYYRFNTQRWMNMTMRINKDHVDYEMMSLSEAVAKFISALFIIANMKVNNDLLSNGNFNFVLDNGNDLVINAITEADNFHANVSAVLSNRNLMSM